MSGLARPWRVAALLAALEAEPETIADLLVASQRFSLGHPFATTSYEGLFGSMRRVRLDPRYTEAPGGHGRALFELDARRVRIEVRGGGWRRAGWLYYHDGESFTRRRVPYQISEAWAIDGTPEERGEQIEWNEGGPEPFGHLLPPEG